MKRIIFLILVFVAIFSCSQKELIKPKEKPLNLEEKNTNFSHYNREATKNYLIALEYKQRGYFRNSIAFLKLALDLEKDYYLYYLISTCYLKTDSLNSAFNYADSAFQLNPNDKDVVLNFVNLLVKKEKISEALKLTNQLIKLDSNNYNYSKLKISFLRYLKEYDKAYRLTDKFIAKDMSLKLKKDFYIIKIGIAKAKGDLEIIEKTYNEYLKKYDKNDQEFLFSLAYFYFRNKNEEKTLEIHKRIYEIKPIKIVYILNYVEILNFYGQEEKGIRILKQNIAKNPDNFDLKFLLASIYSNRKELDNAKSLYTELLKDPKANAKFYNAFGNMYLNNDDFKLASEIFLKGIDKFPNDVSLLNNCAYSLSETGIYLDKALKFSEKTLKMNHNSIYYLDTYGWILYKMGDFVKAEKFITKALNLNKDNSQLEVMLEHLGDISVKMKKKKQAIKYYQEAFEITKNIKFKNKIESLKKDDKK